MKKASVIIQARMGSSRLPNKVLMPLADKPVLEHVIRRCQHAQYVDQVIVATTTDPKDTAVVNLAQSLGVDVFRGSEDDVLDRYYQTAKMFKLQQIVRITADCPMIDPDIIDLVVSQYFKAEADYAANNLEETYPDGEDVEIFSLEALSSAWHEAKLPSQREHVTPYIRQHNTFRKFNVRHEINLGHCRWTLDEPQDYQKLSAIFNALCPQDMFFHMKDVVEFLETHLEINGMNANIVRNEGYQKSLVNDRRKRLLLTGASGYLGSNLLHYLDQHYEVLGLYHSFKLLGSPVPMVAVDLLQKGQVEAVVANFNPDIVLHAAAMANVDTCQQDPEGAREINVRATVNVTEALREYPSKLIYISTDLVYDGSKGNFSEDDHVEPPNVYGKTKLEGEKYALRKKGTLVLRTNFFGLDPSGKRSIAQWAINELSAGRSIQGFFDAIFSCLYTEDMARLVHQTINHDLEGIYNLASSSPLSKYDFLLKVAQGAGLDSCLIKRVSIDSFNFKAPRAKDLSLNVTKLSKALGTKIPSIEEGIQHFLQRRLERRTQYAL